MLYVYRLKPTINTFPNHTATRLKDLHPHLFQPIHHEARAPQSIASPKFHFKLEAHNPQLLQQLHHKT
jgi:hypothetical protein